MPLQQTSGNVTSDAYGGGVAVVPNYIEDVFGTFLYTGNSSTQTITNGIDLAGKGGLVWIKGRSGSFGSGYHLLQDSVRGFGNSTALSSNATDAQYSSSGIIQSATSTGFTMGSSGLCNASSTDYVSWTFRKQPKFFDVVTYTGDGNQKAIAHNLGSAPGFIIAKATNATGDWAVWHRSTTFKQGYLNTTADFTSAVSNFPTNAGTSTTFTVNGPPSGGILSDVGVTYVAYLFAHNAGGFGLTGTDNVISCGSMTVDGSGNATANLGYEPQFVLYKMTSAADDWRMFDTMRGLTASNGSNTNPYAVLKPNTADAEGNFTGQWQITSTGLQLTQPGNAGQTYIYIAIRRGPMKVPTLGTSVFAPATRTGTGATATITSSTYPVDMTWIRQTNNGTGYSFMDFDRLRGPLKLLYTNNDQSQNNSSYTVTGFDVQNGYYLGDDAFGYGTNVSGQPIVYYNFKRAPSFFDEVCYTGTGSATTFSHNLSAVPELMIVKSRSRNPSAWAVYANNDNTDYLVLNTTAATADDNTYWNDTSPTSSVFSVGTDNAVNASASTYVAYLFATCAGVSKVGSYTGNGTTQTINCGFTAGARFVLIKRTDSTGDWYVYDTARGMTVLTDPYLLLNSTAAESATLGSVTTVTTGFAVNASILAAINTNAASYVFLAIS